MTGGSFSYPAVDLKNATAVAVWYETHHIPQRYSPAIVVASVLVALLGSYSTLIVLGRRTSNSGFRNTALLVWAAMNMSCVGIWGMHFIGMNFKLEPLPGWNWYISFSPGFTVFSLIVPFVSLVLAFIFVDYFTLKMWRIAASGTLTGCIVGLMHYSASMKCNFQVSYAPAQTAVSIILACFCAIIALTLFFRLRAQWQDSWQRRLLCSTILAFGVSGMHYLGSSGTSYSVRPENVNDLDRLTRGKHGNTVVVIIVAVMAFVITAASAVMSISDLLSQRETRKKARKIVLASASFDHLGRLMVQADGSLPMVVLEESTLRHSDVLDALDARNEIFQWLFSISWAWHVVAPFLDAIAHRVGERCGTTSCEKEGGVQGSASTPCTYRASLARMVGLHDLSARRDRRRRTNAEKAANATSHNASSAGSRSLALLDFRDRVVDAARRLAEHLEVPMGQVGVFYDHVLPTGTEKQEGAVRALKKKPVRLLRRERARRHKQSSVDVYSEDEEASISTSRAASIFNDGDEDDEGVSIFLVREMPAAEQISLAKKGYRFTETRFLACVLADRHGVGKSRMDELLDGLRVYAKRGTKPVVQPGGVYAGLFGVRPSMTARQGGLDVLVYNFARHQIPAFRLPDIAAVTPEMRTFLRLLDQMPIDQALRVCERESVRTAERNKAIAKLLLEQAHAQMINDSQTAAEAAGRGLSGGSVLHIVKKDESLRQVLDLQTQEASLQAFQIALYTALEALMQSVRVFPRLNSTARISADILEVPSSLDDATPPAHVILVQAVLPADKGPVLRSSASMLGGLMGNTAGGTDGVETVAPPALVTPTETPQSGTPFVFTPYTLFTRTQTMLLRGHTAQAFSAEVQQALSLRFNVHPGDSSYATTSENSRSDASQSIYSPDEGNKSGFDSKDLCNDEADDTHSTKGDDPASATRKGWFTQLKTSVGKQEQQHGGKRKPSYVDMCHDNVVIQLDSTSAATSPVMAQQSPEHVGSLGIRRFTNGAQMPRENGGASTPTVIHDQSRFARPVSEHDESYIIVPGADRRRTSRSGSMTRSGSTRTRTGFAPGPVAVTAVGSSTPRRRSSTMTDLSSTAAVANPTPSIIFEDGRATGAPPMRRQSTARSALAVPDPSSATNATNSDSTALRVHPPTAGRTSMTSSEQLDDPASNADSVQARHRLDNWQMRQLRDLEKFQPNLLLGVLPTEY